MKKMKMTPLKGIALLLLLVTSLGVMAGCNKNDVILEVPPEEEYSYINPNETKAETVYFSLFCQKTINRSTIWTECCIIWVYFGCLKRLSINV